MPVCFLPKKLKLCHLFPRNTVKNSCVWSYCAAYQHAYYMERVLTMNYVIKHFKCRAFYRLKVVIS